MRRSPYCFRWVSYSTFLARLQITPRDWRVTLAHRPSAEAVRAPVGDRLMNYFRSRSFRGKLSLIVLALAAVVPTAVVFRNQALPDLEQLFLLRGRSTFDRSAVFFLDEPSLNYLEFANSEMPEDAWWLFPNRPMSPSSAMSG